jgi:hypothetical protein
MANTQVINHPVAEEGRALVEMEAVLAVDLAVPS